MADFTAAQSSLFFADCYILPAIAAETVFDIFFIFLKQFNCKKAVGTAAFMVSFVNTF